MTANLVNDANPNGDSRSHKRVVSQHLEQSGWRKYQSFGSEIWCKRWNDAARCRCNENHEGIQVSITPHEYEGRHSYEIDVIGEKPDGVWVKLSAYSISQDEIIQASETQANQLVAAWNLLANDQAQRPRTSWLPSAPDVTD